MIKSNMHAFFSNNSICVISHFNKEISKELEIKILFFSILELVTRSKFFIFQLRVCDSKLKK